MEKKVWNRDGWIILAEVPETTGKVWETSASVQLGVFECVSINDRLHGKYRPHLGKDEKNRYFIVLEKEKQSTVE